MKRKVLAIIISFCMTVTMFPMTAMAASNESLTSKGIQEISKKTFAVANGVTEYEWVLNNSTLTSQMAGHVMEVKLSDNATIVAGYGDYNIEQIASGNGWQMMKPTEQAQAIEDRTQQNVVGAINAAGFNMSNGYPSGALVMNGKLAKGTDGTTFWIGTDNKAHISAKADFNAALEAGNVREAVSAFSNGEIVSAGEVKSGLDDSTRASRTAIGIKADGTVVMYMVNGRQAPYSVGMTMAELATAMKALGCESAVNLDGGGSSMFATQREGEADNKTSAGLTMRCRPSDGVERTVASSLMVVSNAQRDGKFNHATITPNQELYTPGSQVQFTASGVDGGGYPVELPEGLTWEVQSGSGTIDENGLYTGSEIGGKVTVALKNGNTVVGTATIELQWPDKLDFTNSSVSLDFGESSALTFNPTYKGQTVHYKDGDFNWSISQENLTYKHSVNLEKYYTPWYQAAAYRWVQLSLLLTGETAEDNTATLSYSYDDMLLYESEYKAKESISVSEDGVVQVSETLSHKGAKLYSFVNGELLKDNIKEDFAAEKFPDEKTYGISGLQSERTFEFALGQFSDNKFTADSDTSMRGIIRVELANTSEVNGSVEVVVGMEPYVLMDFEDHVVNGESQNAEDYWKTKVSSGAATGQLIPDDVKNYRLWVRGATYKNEIYPTDNGQNAIVSSDAEPSIVRFGEYAFKLGWDFNAVDPSAVAIAEFGYSGDVLVDTVQPTKIGMWINVPDNLADDNSLLKAILKGNAKAISNDTAYYTMQEDGSMVYKPGYELQGTSSYVQYYSYDESGNISGSKLSDWAGNGWIWVEADVSAFQMPLDVCRGYTVRVTSPQNCTKGKGYIYIDNLQFIYGTNTNDVQNPNIESIEEANSDTLLTEDGMTLTNGAVAFEVLFDDNEQNDKYATGIDMATVKITVDGRDYTQNAYISSKSLTLSGLTLKNGSHTVVVSMKDYYGNQSTLTRNFNINDDAGEDAALTVVPYVDAEPVLGQNFVLNVTNKISNNKIKNAEIKIKVSEDYKDSYEVSWGEGYEGSSEYVDGGIKLTVNATADSTNFAEQIAQLSFTISADARQGDNFIYTVSSGYYENAAGTATFAEAERKLPITALYKLQISSPIVEAETPISVVDLNNSPVSGAVVYVDGKAIGTTDKSGEIKHTFTSGGRVSLYAQTEQGLSWKESIVVSSLGSEYYDKPFGIQNNGTQDPQTSQSITWLSNIATSASTPSVRYSTDADMAEYTTVSGTSKALTFTEGDNGTALRSNTVRITGLTAGTTYYYTVGSGENWSEIRTFDTAAQDAATTSFFVLGDIQTDNTSALTSVVNRLKNGKYDFAVQTGDAIDGVNKLGQWTGFLTVLNSESLNGVDLIHTMGNHEYYGDADGEVSGTIYDLPKSGQNEWYKMEYGKVCVVVVNHGSDLAGAVEDIAENLTSSCDWKVLVCHQPIYGTNNALSGEKLSQITTAIEAAGFDFVFSGDDHSYARTYPMLNGEKQAETSHEGVVYYVSGDLSSKNNSFTKQDVHAFAKGHEDYKGAYLTVDVSLEKMTVSAYDYNGNLMDTYTKSRSDCYLGKHTFGTASVYDMTAKTLTCTVCNEEQPVGAYSGLVKTSDGKQTVLVSGVPKKAGFTTLGDDVYHSSKDAYAHEAQKTSTLTCTKGGYQVYACEYCSIREEVGQFILPSGHDWDGSHVCKTCGTVGKNIEDADVIADFGTIKSPRESSTVPNYAFVTGGVRPSSFISVDGGKTALTSSNDAGLNSDGTMRDLFVEWPGNDKVGKAQVVYKGRGDYYGTRILNYTISPGYPELTVSASSDSSISLSWNAVEGGADYYDIYTCNANYKDIVWKAKVTGTSYTFENLPPDTGYYFVIRASKDMNSESFRTWSKTVLSASTLPISAEITDVSAFVNDVKVPILNLGEGDYLMLPANADLTKLRLSFESERKDGKIKLSGDKDTKILSSHDTTVDITGLSNAAEGVYTLTAAIGNGTSVSLKLMKASDIPTMYITSGVDGQERAYVDASKSNKTTGSLLMLQKDGSTIYNGKLTQIKARGNSTFTYSPKKSYQIKLKKSSDLLGTGEIVKTWVLLAGYGDATMMHDKLLKDLATTLELPYVASSNWVNLYYDGEYRGVYLLSEKNSVSSTSVDITDMEKAYEDLNEDYGVLETTAAATNKYGQKFTYTKDLTEPSDLSGGYLIELNHNSPDEVSGFYTSNGVAFNVKSPEWAGKDAMTYISEYYQEFENAVYAQDSQGNYTGYNTETGKYFYDYVDMDSLVKTFLLQEFALNSDGFISSLFFYKDAGGKMYAGPIWDQEMTLGTGWSKYLAADVNYQYHYLAESLIKIPAFKDAVDEYYTYTFEDAVQNLMTDKTGYIDVNAELLEPNALMNYTLWDYVRVGSPAASDHIWKNVSYKDTIADMKTWITKRMNLLDELFMKKGQETSIIPDTVNGVSVVAADDCKDGKISFTLKPDASMQAGLKYIVWVSKKDAAFADWQRVYAENGVYSADFGENEGTVHVYVCGDVNMDGKVNVGDVSDILRNVANDNSLSGVKFAVADYNGDNNVNVGDVSDMLRFIANN